MSDMADPELIVEPHDDDNDDRDGVMVLEEVESELVLMVWEPTGEPRVDDALDLLATLDVDSVHQHAAVYSEIHEQLRSTLSNADAPTD
jgi:hypothetical protein